MKQHPLFLFFFHMTQRSFFICLSLYCLSLFLFFQHIIYHILNLLLYILLPSLSFHELLFILQRNVFLFIISLKFISIYVLNVLFLLRILIDLYVRPELCLSNAFINLTFLLYHTLLTQYCKRIF